MEEIFGIEKSCWGHTNVNSIIHPELVDLAGVQVNKRLEREMKKGRKKKRRRKNK